MLHFFFTAITPNHSSDTYKSGCVGDMYPHGECKYSFSDGHTRVIVGMRSSLVGTGVTALPFQYSSTQAMMAPPDVNLTPQPDLHAVECRSISSTIVASQSACETSSSVPIVSYPLRPSSSGLRLKASTPYSVIKNGRLLTRWYR